MVCLEGRGEVGKPWPDSVEVMSRVRQCILPMIVPSCNYRQASSSDVVHPIEYRSMLAIMGEARSPSASQFGYDGQSPSARFGDQMRELGRLDLSIGELPTLLVSV